MYRAKISKFQINVEGPLLWWGVMSREEVGMRTLAPCLEHMDDRTKLIDECWDMIGSLWDPNRMM
jgi:hypothetical protein